MNVKIIIILFFSFFIASFVSADVVFTWDDTLLNGKIIKIVESGNTDKKPDFIAIINSLGTFEIAGEDIFAYWITDNPDEDIKIYIKLGKELTPEEEETIKDEYLYGAKSIIEMRAAEQDATIVDTEKVTDDVTIDVPVDNQNTVKETVKFRKINYVNALGIGVTVFGGTLLCAGAALLIYDLAGYKPIVDYKYDNNRVTISGYEDYYSSYMIYTGVLAASVASIITSSLFISVGIPLILFKQKKTVFSFAFTSDKKMQIDVCFRF